MTRQGNTPKTLPIEGQTPLDLRDLRHAARPRHAELSTAKTWRSPARGTRRTHTPGHDVCDASVKVHAVVPRRLEEKGKSGLPNKYSRDRQRTREKLAIVPLATAITLALASPNAQATLDILPGNTQRNPATLPPIMHGEQVGCMTPRAAPGDTMDFAITLGSSALCWCGGSAISTEQCIGAVCDGQACLGTWNHVQLSAISCNRCRSSSGNYDSGNYDSGNYDSGRPDGRGSNHDSGGHDSGGSSRSGGGSSTGGSTGSSSSGSSSGHPDTGRSGQGGITGTNYGQDFSNTEHGMHGPPSGGDSSSSSTGGYAGWGGYSGGRGGSSSSDSTGSSSSSSSSGWGGGSSGSGSGSGSSSGGSSGGSSGSGGSGGGSGGGAGDGSSGAGAGDGVGPR